MDDNGVENGGGWVARSVMDGTGHMFFFGLFPFLHIVLFSTFIRMDYGCI